jgi:hypothetical protein
MAKAYLPATLDLVRFTRRCGVPNRSEEKVPFPSKDYSGAAEEQEQGALCWRIATTEVPRRGWGR